LRYLSLPGSKTVSQFFGTQIFRIYQDFFKKLADDVILRPKKQSQLKAVFIRVPKKTIPIKNPVNPVNLRPKNIKTQP